MKHRHIFIILAFLCTQALATEKTSPAADQASFKFIRGVKIAMQNQPDKFNPKCVPKIPDHLLSPYIQLLLTSGLSSSELEEMNNFYSTKLAIEFDNDMIAQKEKIPNYKPIQFSSSEKMVIGDALTSPAASKYFSIVSEDNQDFMKLTTDVLRPFLELCSQRPN